MKGYFITVEGIEGAGKSTAMQYCRQLLESKDIPLVVTREPGGTPVAEEIRQLLLHYHEESVCDDTELLLMFAARAQHLAKLIKPALEAGKWVLCDRFTDASFAYQGGGRGIPVERLQIIEEWVQRGLQPDLTLLLDLPVEQGMARIQKRSTKDRIEKEKNDFFQRVRDMYLQRAEQYSDRYRIIDASLNVGSVEPQIEQQLQALIKTYQAVA